MTYRAGIIGTGGIAGMGILGLHAEEDIGEKKFKASHAGGYQAHDEIKLVTAADVDEEKLAKFGDAWDIPSDRRYTEYEDMLRKEDLDVVSVCSPTYLHHEHVVTTAESTSSPAVIWCEKPIASSVSDGKHMIAKCEDNDVNLLINHSFRFTEKIQRLKEEIDSGLLGDVRSVTAQFRRELLRNSTHLLDTLVYLFDARAKTVHGHINGKNDAVTALEGGREVDDAGGAGLIVLDDETVVSVDCTIARDISSMNLQIIGTEGKLSLNIDDGEWRYWSLEESGHVERPIPGIDKSWTWEGDYREAFPNATGHIIDLLNGEVENHSSGRDANRTMEIIVAMYISHYTGSQVSIPLDRPLQDITITSW